MTEEAILSEIVRIQGELKGRSSYLSVIGVCTPMIGLTGTVTGMMGSFAVIGGDLSSPGAITGGIAEALIATAFGLGIAILSLLPFNYLNSKMDEATHDIESASTQLKLLVDTRSHAPRAAAGDEPEEDLAFAGNHYDGASTSLPGGA